MGEPLKHRRPVILDRDTKWRLLEGSEHRVLYKGGGGSPPLTTGWSWRAKAAAFTKADINPSFRLCFFRNASLCSALISWMLLKKEKLYIRPQDGGPNPGPPLLDSLPHIHLIEGGQHCTSVLSFLQPLSDSLTHAVHFHLQRAQ